MARVAPYGSWRSPITAEWLARRSTYLMEPRLDGDAVWWIELRPAESGRSVVVRANPDGSGRAEAIAKDHSARTRVHEYGGGAYAVKRGIVFYSNDADGRVYRDGDPITPEPPKPRALRYADFEISPDGGTVYCVREAHREDRETVNEIVAISAAGDGEPEGDLLNVTQAARELRIAPSTLLRWLDDGFVAGEQITPGAPWQIRLTGQLQAMLTDNTPDGWVPLAYATQALGVSRQTVLQKVKRGELRAVLTRTGRRKGLRIELPAPQDGLF